MCAPVRSWRGQNAITCGRSNVSDGSMLFALQGISIDELSVEQFRRRCVEPMGEESDEVHIVALTDVLQVGLYDAMSVHQIIIRT